MRKRKIKDSVTIIDIDDTLFNFTGFLCYLYNKLNGTCVSSSDIKEWNFDNLELIDARGNKVIGKNLRNLMYEYETEIYSALPLLENVKFALDTIKAIGYKIILLTARKDCFKKSTIVSLLSNELPYDEIIFDWDKAKIINDLSKKYIIKLFIDDNAQTIDAVAQLNKVEHICLLDKPHNRNFQIEDGIIRVESLFDSIRYLKEVINEN